MPQSHSLVSQTIYLVFINTSNKHLSTSATKMTRLVLLSDLS